MFNLYLKDIEQIDLANELVKVTEKIIITNEIPDSSSIYLQLDKFGLAIITPNFSPIYIKDIYSKINSRIKFKDELLIQAINMKVSANPLIFDLTAGFGKDAAILANYGYNLIMIERNYILATILFYALKVGLIPKEKITLLYEDSFNFMQKYSGKKPNIIYIDPMFDQKTNSLSKKEMQLIQILTKADDNNNELLFKLSLKFVNNKLIIKRDNKQENLVISPLPSYSKRGKTIRYDIYIPRPIPTTSAQPL